MGANPTVSQGDLRASHRGFRASQGGLRTSILGPRASYKGDKVLYNGEKFCFSFNQSIRLSISLSVGLKGSDGQLEGFLGQQEGYED